MAAGKGNKHGGRKTRIKNYKKTKHYRQAQEARRKKDDKRKG
jgi:hypothetical protein